MSILIITVVFGLIFAYFATLNTALVSVNIGNITYTMPLYALALGSVLIGLLISGIINTIDSLSSSFALRSKENKIRQREHTVEELSMKVHELQLENARLRGHHDSIPVRETTYEEHQHRPRSFFDRFRLRPT